MEFCKHLFAMPLEVILSKNGSIFSHIYLLLHFLEGKCIICHLIAYYPKIGDFLQLKVFFRRKKVLKYPKIILPFCIESNCKIGTLLDVYFMTFCKFRAINCHNRRSRFIDIKH